MEDPRSGVQVGIQNLHFPEKAAPDMKKWLPRQALEKGSCLEGVKTLKMMTLTSFSVVFKNARGSQKGPQIRNRRQNVLGLHRGLEKEIFVRFQNKHKKVRKKGQRGN